MRNVRTKTKLLCCLVIVLTLGRNARADGFSVDQLADMSIEQLSQVTVTSAAKREQSLNDVSSAIFVISQNDIRRSTATTIPELLRMVPGLFVAQVGAHTWAITARGFGGNFANKLLVVMDGRSVYSPLFSGTYWEVQDYPLADIERIEVIRGPGGTLWGSNAVNGVINITTKNAKDTQGILASGGGGNEARGIGDVRYGFASDNWAGRVYGRGRVIDDANRESGGPAGDGYGSGQGGFKLEREISPRTSLTVQGDIYAINEAERLQIPVTTSPYTRSLGRQSQAKGGNLLARLSAPGLGAKDKSSMQVYFDRTNRSEIEADSAVTIFDLDTQYELHGLEWQTVTFGAGIRHIGDSIASRNGLSFDPEDRTSSLVNTFAQDEFTVIPAKLTFTTGIKLEHNEYTGAEWQPTARLTWHPAAGYSLWSAVSRAVRIPSRTNNDLSLDVSVVPPNAQVPIPTVIELTSSRNLDAEAVISYEIGTRGSLTKTVSLDVATFFADYSDLQTYDLGTPQISARDGGPVAIQPLDEGNRGRAHVYGIENVLEWSPHKEVRVQLWYSLQLVETRVPQDSTDTFLKNEEHNNPKNQIGLRGQFNLPYDLEFNPFVRFVDSVSSVDADSYWEADMQLAWKAQSNLRIALNLSNALHDSHREYRTEIPSRVSTEIERSVFLSALYQY